MQTTKSDCSNRITTAHGGLPCGTLRLRALSNGFTLVEVAMAATVLLLALSSSIVALQGSFRMLDISRGLTLSSQIAQSEIERIRLDDWSHLPASGTVDISSTFSADPVLASKFSALRTISDTPGKVGSMKDIVIDVTWRTSDDKVHSRAYKAQYAKKGIYDYDYTKAR